MCFWRYNRQKEPGSPNLFRMKNCGTVEKPMLGDEDPFIFGFILAVKDFFINTLYRHENKLRRNETEEEKKTPNSQE